MLTPSQPYLLCAAVHREREDRALDKNVQHRVGFGIIICYNLSPFDEQWPLHSLLRLLSEVQADAAIDKDTMTVDR